MTYRTTQWAFEQIIVLVSIAVSIGAIGWAYAATGDQFGDDWLVLGIVAVVLLAVLFMPLSVDVTSDRVRIRLAYFARRDIPVANIASVEVRDYRPIRQFGGWGWRYGKDGARQYAMTGNRAVVVTLKDGSDIYLGTRDLVPLADAIDRARALIGP